MTPSIRSTVIGQGKPLVLLHAFPLSHKLFAGLQPPTGYAFILPDFPGFGQSPLANPGLTLAEAADGLENHLKDLNLSSPVVLGGISMGGYWAMEFLRRYPSKASKILFISTRPGVDKPEGRQNRLNMAEKVVKDGTGYLVEAMTPGLLGKTSLNEKPEAIRTLGQWIRETDPKAVALAQRAMADRRDQTDLMPRITAPTMILAGREDNLIPVSESESMAKAIPSCRLEILERVGHLVPLENPDEFQKILARFVAE